MITLICNKNSKRYTYFKQACDNLNITLNLVDYRDIYTSKIESLVKIEPMETKLSIVNEQKDFINEYFQYLDFLASKKASFYNSIENIKLCIDKKKVKKILKEHGLSITPVIDRNFTCFDELYSYAKENRLKQIFIKPNIGSGASGIMAVKFNFKLDKAIVYSTSRLENNRLVNCKKIFKTGEKKKVIAYINQALALDPIIEKWIRKATINGYSYDLRVVCLFGKIEYIIARLSNSPITNLHINNRALSYKEIGLSEDMYKKIEHLCLKTCEVLNLTYAGIDILVSSNQKDIYIIEVNSQGDCIYDDMKNENRIYTNQIKEMISREG